MSRICIASHRIASHSCAGYHADARTHKDIKHSTPSAQHRLIYTFGWKAVITSRRIIINKSYLITCRLQMRSNTLAKWSENRRNGVTTTATTSTTTQIHRHRHCQQQIHIVNRMKYSKGLKIWLVLFLFYYFARVFVIRLWVVVFDFTLLRCVFFLILFVGCCFFVSLGFWISRLFARHMISTWSVNC